LLTRRHLAVLRAALQYFDEELMPHGIGAMRPYFDEPLNVELKTPEIRELQKFLRDCGLKYAGYDPTSARLTSSELSESADEARLMTDDPAPPIAVVLLPPPG
jgi:hypothetical protein